MIPVFGLRIREAATPYAGFVGSVSRRRTLSSLCFSPAYDSEVWKLQSLAPSALIVTPFLKGVTSALLVIHVLSVWLPLKRSRIDRVFLFDGVDVKQESWMMVVILGMVSGDELHVPSGDGRRRRGLATRVPRS